LEFVTHGFQIGQHVVESGHDAGSGLLFPVVGQRLRAGEVKVNIRRAKRASRPDDVIVAVEVTDDVIVEGEVTDDVIVVAVDATGDITIVLKGGCRRTWKD
jgi:hypothetical protein